MKVRSITLNNIRKFTTSVSVKNIRNGINIISEANEAGKSTLFDALRATFFSPHSSRSKDIQSLQPHAGGAPEVTLEIEVNNEPFTIFKRWLSKPKVTITQGNTLLAQADKAEEWIEKKIGHSSGGPSGLLWVRQGITSLEEGKDKESQNALEARRDLLSSVTGEVEAVTGGKRMDIALERCSQELSLYVTETGRPKKGGPLEKVRGHLDELVAKKDSLEKKLTELQVNLDERRKLRIELAGYEDEEEASRRKTELEVAKATLEKAKQADSRIQAIDEKIEFQHQLLESEKTGQQRLKDCKGERKAALEEVSTASDDFGKSSSVLGELQKALQETMDSAERCLNEHMRCERQLNSAKEFQQADAEQLQRIEKKERLAKAEEARNRLENANALASLGPDAKTMSRFEDLISQLKAFKRTEEASLPRIVMRYDNDSVLRVLLDNEPLPDGESKSINRTTPIVIPNIGKLTVTAETAHNGESTGQKLIEQMREMVEKFGAKNVDQMRQRGKDQALASENAKVARAELNALAPDGIDALRAEIAAIPQSPLPTETDLTVEEAQDQFDAARQAKAEANASANAAREAYSKAKEEHERLSAKKEAAEERLERAERELSKLPEKSERDYVETIDGIQDELDRLRDTKAELVDNEPDLSAAEATFARAEAVIETANSEIVKLKEKLAELNMYIQLSSGNAIEENLQQITDEHSRVDKDLRLIEKDIQVLNRLKSALVNARTNARQQYFEPVATELKPLLRHLWPGADLVWDDASLLPERLIRDGQEEPISILSGGTQEQIALLVRLAFARLLEGQGQSVPVILDDALVFTDDDRIESMFNALHQDTGEMQILVLSCRQRAFRNLGGNRLRFEAN